MIKPKLKLLALAITLLLIGLGMGGCKRCVICTGTYLCIECYKNTDTIKDCNWKDSPILSSMVNDHQVLGYTCDTFKINNEEIDLCKYSVSQDQLEASGLICKKEKL